MTKGIEHGRNFKKKPVLSLKEKRQRKHEKKQKAHQSLETPPEI